MGVLRLLTVLAVLTASVVGCSLSTDAGARRVPKDPAPLAGLDVTLMQYTHDEVNRDLVVRIANTSSGHSIGLDSLEVHAPGFDGADRLDFNLSLVPGALLDLRIPYGKPRCDVTDPATEVVVRFGLPDTDATGEVVAPEGSELLDEIRGRECAATRMREVVPVRWSGTWRGTGSGRTRAVHGLLQVGPVTSGEKVRLVSIERTVVFSAESTRLPITLGPGETVDLDVRFVAARCDPHVLADAPQGFDFQARFRRPGAPADGSEDVLVPVAPDRSAKNLLTDGWLERCGFPPRVIAPSTPSASGGR